MYINAFVRAILSRFRLPLRNWSSLPSGAEKGEIWLDQVRPHVVSDEATPQLLRLLTNLDIGTTVASLANGRVPASQLPELLEQFINTNTNLTLDPPAHVGEIRMWGGHPLRVPSGWLVCDGSFVSRTTYADLYAVIGNTWGRPANETTFALPNLLGRMPIGAAPPSAFIGTGYVHKVVVHAGGSGYTPGVHTVTGLNVSSPAIQLTAAQLRIHVTSAGSVSHIEVIQGGSYQNVSLNNNSLSESDTTVALPLGSWSPLGSSGLKYSIHFVGAASHQYAWGIRITNRGSNYTSTPEVILSGGSLVGATARAIRSIHNDIIGVVITNPGNGQFTGASVTITGGGGSGATAELVQYVTPVAVGDVGGEHWRRQLTPELAPHAHEYETPQNAVDRMPDGGNVWDDNRSPATTSVVGNALAMPMLPAFAGVVFIIRCKP